MKPNKITTYFLLITTMLGWGCGVFTPTPAAQTSQVTTVSPQVEDPVLPLPSPTVAPTPTPKIDFSFAIPQPSDIGSEAMAMPMHMIGVTSKDLLGVEFEEQQVFLIFKEENVLTGFVVHLPTETERQKFIKLAEETTYNSPAMLAYTDTYFNGREPLLNSVDYDLRQVGDFQVNYTLSYPHKLELNTFTNLEMIFFTRAEMGVFLVNEYDAGDASGSILSSLALKIDERITRTLKTGMPMTQAAPPAPDYSWMTPTLTQINLPEIKQISLDELGVDLGAQQVISDISYDNAFVFMEERSPKILIGYTIFLDTYEEIGAFDLLIDQMDLIISEFALSLSATDIHGLRSFWVREIGDISSGYSLLGTIENIPLHFTGVLFRKGQVGTLMIAIQPPVPDEFNYMNDWTFEGTVDVRTLARHIDYLTNYLLLYDLPTNFAFPQPDTAYFAPSAPDTSATTLDLTFATPNQSDISRTEINVIPSNFLNFTSSDFLGTEFEEQMPFLVIDKPLVGVAVHLKDQAEREKFINTANTFVVGSSELDWFLNKYYSAFSSVDSFTDPRLEDLGDFQKSYTITYYDFENPKIVRNLEVAFFTRGEIGVFAVSSYYPFNPGEAILSEVLLSVDQRIEKTLAEGGIPEKTADWNVKDYSWLSSNDLFSLSPAKMAPMNLEELNTNVLVGDLRNLFYDNYFAFKDETGSRTLVGYNVFMNSPAEVGTFDIYVTKTKEILLQLATSMGVQDLQNFLPLSGKEYIYSAETLTGTLNGKPVHISLAMFRVGEVGTIYIAMQPSVPSDYHLYHTPAYRVVADLDILTVIDNSVFFSTKLYQFNTPKRIYFSLPQFIPMPETTNG